MQVVNWVSSRFGLIVYVNGRYLFLPLINISHSTDFIEIQFTLSNFQITLIQAFSSFVCND